MRNYGVLVAVCAALTLGASTASAQDAAKVGLTMSSGSTIGLQFPVGEQAAIRATIGFSRSTSDYEGTQFIEESISTTTLGPGASVLFYLKSWDATRLYVSPQYTFSRLSTSRADDEPRTGHSGAFMIGAQHGLSERFGVFAEGGLGWSRVKNSVTSQLDSSSITNTTWSSRGVVGGILFF